MADSIRVLSVDDEPALLDMGKLFLERGGEFSVDTAISAADALDILQKKNYDAIVSDYLMPEMDGIEFLKKVRATQRTIPFIIFTGRGREDVVIEAINNGADFYLQKGGSPNTLYTELGHVIRRSVLFRRTQRSLAEQEQRYHDLQNANDLIQSVAPDGRFLYVNKKWLDTLGYEEHEVSDLTIFDVIDKESLNHCMATFQRVMSGENVGIIGAIFRTRDGKRVYVEGMADCKIVEGQPQYTRGMFKDVTDRILAEAALKESEARYRDVVEDQTEFISRFRPDCTHVFVNDAYCRYFNITREEVIGRRFIPEISEEDRALVTQHLASLTKENPTATIMHRIIKPDGQVRWQRWNDRAIFDDQGAVIEYQSVGRDITDLKDVEQELLRKNEEINASFEELIATEEELRKNFELISEKEQALRESEAKYRNLAELLPQMVFEVDMDFRLTYANENALKATGYTNHDLEQGLNALSFIDPSQHGRIMENVQKQIKGIPFDQEEYTAKRKDGSTFTVIIYSAPIYHEMTITGFRGAIVDISARKKIENGLRESEEKFRALVEQSLDGTIITDFTGMFLFANARMGEILHHNDIRDIVGKRNVFEFITPEFQENAVRDFAKVAAGTDSYVVNYKILTMDNKEIWVECIGKKISYAGSPAMLLSVHDITERKQIETALIESDKRSRLILQSANDAIFIHEISTENPGRFIEVNDQACQMLGYTREELLGMGIPEIDVPEQNEHVPEILEKLFSTGKAVFQTDFLTKDGRRIPIEDSNRLINLDGKPVVLCIARDLSEQKRTEQVLQAANRKLNLLSRITRHDINNQLLTLHGYVEMLRNKIPDPALEESFTRIMDAGDRISRMIEFTREYEKIGVSAPVWQDCRTLVDTATRESWPGKVTVKNDIPAGTSVYGDPLITKVFYNLMDNAARYGGENPTLRFSVQNCNGDQIIVCEDNGEGVPADRKERIFDRGYGKNTGLGLALSREILDITGITIRETGEPGKGARFEMTVPKGHFRSISP